MSWRPAKSLEVLKGQLDATYPGWLFLGFLGDAAHAAVASDHNPNAAGVVCALDIGPGGGLDIHALADRLLAVRHPDLKYIISNRRIGGAWTSWKWSAYGGSDPHDTHIHISVGIGDDGQSLPPYDDTNLWNVKGETMSFIEPATIKSLSAQFEVPLTADQISYYSKHPGGYTELYTDFLKYNYDKRKQAENAASASATVLKAGTYKVI